MTPTGQHTATLLVGAQAGDTAALQALLEQVRPDAIRLAARHCRLRADADDAVQETLFTLSRRFPGIRSPAALWGWLKTVVVRECRRLFDAASARASQSPQRSLTELASDGRLSQQPMHDLRIDLAAALASLPAHYREIVLRRDLLEMSIDEIAGELALTREAVKARLHRARLLLREYLHA